MPLENHQRLSWGSIIGVSRIIEEKVGLASCALFPPSAHNSMASSSNTSEPPLVMTLAFLHLQRWSITGEGEKGITWRTGLCPLWNSVQDCPSHPLRTRCRDPLAIPIFQWRILSRCDRQTMVQSRVDVQWARNERIGSRFMDIHCDGREWSEGVIG